MGRPTWLWIGVAVIVFTTVPNLRAYLDHSTLPLTYIWDWSNFVAWTTFVQHGLVPMKDFFYPYGFQWVFDSGISSGPVYEWLVQAAELAIAAWSLWRLSGGRTWRVLGCLVFFVLIGLWATAGIQLLGLANYDGWRYASGFLVGVTYAALGPGAHTRLTRGHGVFLASCLLALFWGTDAFLMGLAAGVLVLLGEIVGGRLAGPARRLVGALTLDVAPVVIAAAICLLAWVALGAVSGNVRFLSDFSALSSADALDERLYGPLGLVVLYPAAYSLVAAIPALTAAAGALWYRLAPRELPNVGALLLAAAGVSLVLVVKDFVRTIGDEPLIAPLLALGWGVILTWRPGSLVRTAAATAAIAAVLTMLDETGALSITRYVHDTVVSPATAVRSVGVAFDPAERARAAREQLNPARYAGWPDLVIADYYLKTVHSRPLPPFAVIGDSQSTYAFLNQRPPYQVELYDSAPIAEQQAMVRALKQENPPYVIWRSNYAIDDVPYTVRDPLVLTWMIENYVPVRQFEGAAILRRRRPSEALPQRYWRSQLSTQEALGYIPSYSGAASSPSCTSGRGCVAYALVRLHATKTGGGIGFVVSGNGESYAVTLLSRAGVDEYPVRLDRLWFWPLVGPRPKLTLLTPGMTLEALDLRSGDNLY